jgi:hypothetical protein
MTDHPIISRAEAKTKGLKRFFTGEPCCHGHFSERHTSSGGCYACYLAREKAKRANSPASAIRAIRAEAKATGKITYSTGRPCRRGHTADRFTSSGTCIECSRLASDAYAVRNPDKVKAFISNWQSRNKKRCNANGDAWKKTHPLKARAWNKKASKKYREKTPEFGRIAAAARRACLIQQMPSWADRKAIAAIYRACPKGMQVDHVVPLNGKFVSGLHVHYNLQYLAKSENGRKSNRFNPLA